MSEPKSPQANSDEIREHLSALMDGALSRDETRFLLRRVDADGELAGTWSRYQLIHSVLKREAFEVQPVADFSSAVIARLDTAQTVRPVFRVLRWAGGGAIAAGVALVALTVSRPVHDPVAPAQIIAAAVPVAQPAVAAAPAIAVDPAPQQQPWLQNMLSPTRFDYAQPASFDTSAYLLPRYVPGNSYAVPNANMPFVLRMAPVPEAKTVQPAAPAPRH